MSAIQQLLATYKPAAGGGANGLLTSLTSYYKADEASGNLLDAHSTRNFTAINTPGTNAGGLISSSRTFSAASDQGFRNTTQFSLPNNTTAFSWHMWCYPTGGAGYRVFLDWGASNEYELYLNAGAGTYNLSFYSGGVLGLEPITGPLSMTVNTWNRVALIYDGAGGLKIVLNNATPYTDTWTPPASGVGATVDVHIGEDINTGAAWEGRLDEIGYWQGRALNATDLTNLYNGGAGLAYSSFT
jgi:hypothetical protein